MVKTQMRIRIFDPVYEKMYPVKKVYDKYKIVTVKETSCKVFVEEEPPVISKEAAECYEKETKREQKLYTFDIGQYRRKYGRLYIIGSVDMEGERFSVNVFKRSDVYTIIYTGEKRKIENQTSDVNQFKQWMKEIDEKGGKIVEIFPKKAIGLSFIMCFPKIPFFINKYGEFGEKEDTLDYNDAFPQSARIEYSKIGVTDSSSQDDKIKAFWKSKYPDIIITYLNNKFYYAFGAEGIVKKIDVVPKGDDFQLLINGKKMKI